MEGRAAASEGWGVWIGRELGWACVSGADEARIGDEGAWQSPWFDVFGVAESKEEVFCVVEADGVFGLQCCCWGVVGDGSVGAVQWLWGSV